MSGPSSYDKCECGNIKAKKSKTCLDCYSSTLVKVSNPRDFCQCGSVKMKKSKLCQKCRDDYRNKNIPGFRGPLPSENEAAIYLLRNAEGKVFYVGSSKNPRKRLTSHRFERGDITMLVVKIVPIENQWREEIEAMNHYGFYTIPRSPKEVSC